VAPVVLSLGGNDEGEGQDERERGSHEMIVGRNACLCRALTLTGFIRIFLCSHQRI
jgi:hypothetical protein